MSACCGSATSMTVRPGRSDAERARKAPARDAAARLSALASIAKDRDSGPALSRARTPVSVALPAAGDSPAAGGGHLGDGERSHAAITSWARPGRPAWRRPGRAAAAAGFAAAAFGAAICELNFVMTASVRSTDLSSAKRRPLLNLLKTS